MRILVIAVFAVLFLSWQTAGSVELTNTTWAGSVNVPDAAEGTFAFTKDSLILSINGSPIETMLYKTQNDTLMLKKLSGISPCSDEQVLYRYEVKDDVLTFTDLMDNCDERKYALKSGGYKKQK